MLEMNQVLDRIDELLTEDIDLSSLSREALISEHHLEKMFTTLSGISLTEYVSHRRLTVATEDIVAGVPANEVASKYRYASPEAFISAFRSFHSLDPSAALPSSERLRSQPRLRFQETFKEVSNMGYRVVEKPGFYLTGFRAPEPLVHVAQSAEVINFSKSLDPADKNALMAINNTEPAGQLSVFSETEDSTWEKMQLDYWYAVATTQTIDDPRFEQLTIPLGTWVVFETEGFYAETVHQMWEDAATEWFPAHPYRWAPGPQILRVDHEQNDATAYAELWLPITAVDEEG